MDKLNLPKNLENDLLELKNRIGKENFLNILVNFIDDKNNEISECDELNSKVTDDFIEAYNKKFQEQEQWGLESNCVDLDDI
ncbi:MAG: hypothetical protein R3Y52_02805 [Psittacicella sp.]